MPLLPTLPEKVSKTCRFLVGLLWRVSHTGHCFVSSYLITPLMGADLNAIIRTQELLNEHVQFLVYQILRGLKVTMLFQLLYGLGLGVSFWGWPVVIRASNSMTLNKYRDFRIKIY